jgi:hypothetical protein
MIGAVLLFSILAYSTNTAILNSTDRNLQLEYLNAAISVTQSYISEIRSKAYDEKTITNTITDNSFSSTLGTDGEVYPNFDDIDDYNGYVFKDINTKYAGTYKSSVKISYVNPTSLIASSTPTKMKRIVVSTYSKNLSDTLKMNYYSSY